MLSRAAIVAKLQAALDPERFAHSLRVEKTALFLARKFGADRRRVSAAALLHDCARRYDRQGLLRAARKMGVKIDAIQRFEPKLLHAELGAHLAKQEFGVSSTGILNAIRRHTTGAPRMTKLDKIIYLADHIEMGRNYAEVRKLRKLAFRDLDRAVFESTSATLNYLLRNRLPIYPGTIATRNSFLKIS